ncbi:cleavage stimulation factor subunit 3-like [Hydractinia symbiolongicarpus]|uniref:cleavage stimulation factor subunit 3-like n=1 Tax=Hydractinia symbiolongicarpus TaxID=13093 RepID=UPI002550079D|nr:cleavage stimulation factor subunit 3-like [Hydractinia symbiolongicarpus]XP_057314297.1 cleavage stimulation factor subunit 3-like [Hydractinia symbiolongicarpus]
MPPKKESIVTQWNLSERGRKAESLLLETPYDVDAWGVLLREAQNYPVDQARDLYERLVTQFPTAGKYWKLYIDQEMKYKNFDRVEKLFQRCLIKILNMDLWKTYLSYVKETKQALASFREKMIQAYEFAIDKIGLDQHSYPVWCEYINFLKAGEAQGAYAENQKIGQIRKVYSRAVHTPIHNIEVLWKDYSHFEMSVNKMLAEKLIHEKTREYQNARRAVKECETVTHGFNRSLPATPPTGAAFESSQKQLWRKYIGWERSNPLKADDQNLVVKRVMFAFEQCLLCYAFHPDMWYEAASYLENTGRELIERGDMQSGQKLWEEAVALYERATSTFLKNNLLLHFSYADFEESRKRYQKVHSIYDKLLEENIDPTLVYCQYMKFSRRAEGIKECREIFKRSREDGRAQFHVFISAALIEHYSNKNSKVATNIFELGLKKYADNEDYIMAYIDYKIAQNEDNNTRVLFERLLSIVPREKQRLVLGRYMEFEARYGDLASIFKIDKRMSGSNSSQTGFEERDPTMLVERYKYIDLLPCSANELRSMGYTPRAAKSNITDTSYTPAPVTETSVAVVKKELPKPDFNQMKPFKPTIATSARMGTNIASGGVFPAPPAVADLLLQLPPPTSFRGPFVIVDKLIESMLNVNLDDVKSHQSLTNGDDKRGMKRLHDSDDESSYQPPSNDLYRSRQQKRVHPVT